jgi:2-succinyl-6-hydroxy-2,4-cyclohexadiene-1-carboxylate synthase
MNKAPLILLHGWLGGPEDWRPFRDKLGGAFDCHAMTLPGHAGAPPPEPETPSGVLRRMADEWPAQDGPAILMGYSMGGRIAMRLALRHLRRVSMLVVVSASPGEDDPAERRRRRELDEERARQLETGRRGEFVTAWYDQPLFASLKRKPALRRALIAARSRNSGPGVAALLRAFGAGRAPSLWPRLGRLSIPTWWVAGEHDEKYASLMKRAADLSPDGRAIIVPGSGHMPHIEQPGRLAAIVRQAAGRFT